MIMKRKLFGLLAASVLMLTTAMQSQAAPQTTAFTYQGQLNAGGILPSGQNYQFTFTLYDAATDGNVVGAPIQRQILVASGGLFTADLDFGQIFNGEQYWLEIKVGTTIPNEQPLSSRQPISAVPVAQYALNSNAPARLVFLSSAAQANVTTTVGGFSEVVAVLPLSGAVSSAYQTATNGIFLDLTPNGATPPPPQILPVDGQLGSISAQIFVTEAFLPTAGTVITLRAQVYVGSMGSGIMFPVPGLTCVLAPAFSSFIPIGASASCLTTGAAVPVSAGSSAVVVVSATASGPGIFNSVPMTVSVGVGP